MKIAYPKLSKVEAPAAPSIDLMIKTIARARVRLGGRISKQDSEALLAAEDYLRGESEDERENADSYFYPDDDL